MEGKWLIADRDLNEREGLKWLLKTSTIPVMEIYLAANFQEFVFLFEKEAPQVVLLELDMIHQGDWSTFSELMQIYRPILLFTSAEATFEKARIALDLQALDLMIKPLSTTKVKSAFNMATQKLEANQLSERTQISRTFKEESYESLFIPHASGVRNAQMAAFKTEMIETIPVLHSFLEEYPFKDLQGIYPLNDMVIILFTDRGQELLDQCQKAMRRWEGQYSEPLAVVVHKDPTSNLSVNQKFLQTQKMLEFTYFKGYRQVVEFRYSQEWAHIDPFLSPTEQRYWVDLLSSFHIEKIKQWLYNEFLQLQDPYPDPGLVRIRLTSILAQIRRFMKTHHLDENQETEKEYRTIFHSILYDTVLYRTVQNLILFIQKLFSATESMGGTLMQDPIERAILFLEENYSNIHIKLEDVAAFVDRNPSYFSHLFTSRTGTSFTDVLTGIRLKQAKRLLIETNKAVKEISALVGYQNSNYFSRIFKDKVGVSPRIYRMQKETQQNG
ncbi:helix-turn-helix domain-containing protein [Neobacillus sp. LXY-1]|uniref:helix-turn-helix domain-containing protein n=1 Tax=Neobacillus sp. LXY-1 TaxID=3379133 RepID=UPI003EE13448